MTMCNKSMRNHLQEMMQEDEGATIRLEELERMLRQITIIQSMKSLLRKAMKNIRSSME